MTDTYEYNTFGNITKRKDYVDSSNPITTNFTYTYSSGGVTIKEEKEGLSGTLKLDKMGLMTEATDYYDAKKTYTYDKLGRLTQSYIYPQNTLSEKMYNIGAGTYIKTADVKYDDGSNTITDNMTGVEYHFGKFGKISSVKDGTKTLLTYEYDSSMRLISEKDGIKGEVKYVYDSLSRVTKKQNLDYSMSAVLYEEQYAYEIPYNALTSRITTTIPGDANSPTIENTQYINKMGQTVKLGCFDDNTEYLSTFEYDYLGNIIKSTNSKHESEVYTYNFAGQVTSKSRTGFGTDTIAYDYLGRVTDATNNGVETSYTYDKFSRVLTETNPLGTTIYEYNDSGSGTFGYRSVTRTDAEDNVTVSMYDKLGRLGIVKTNDGNGQVNYTSYKYDVFGNVVEMYTGLNRSAPFENPSDLNSVLTSEGHLTKYDYDKLGRLLSIKDPSGLEEKYEYNQNGNMTKKIDRNKNVITNQYDAMNRIKKVTSSGGNERFEYDYYKTNLIKELKNETMTIGYKYDSLGRMVEETESNGIVKAYSYDSLNNRTSFNLKSNGITELNLSYEYNKAISSPTKVIDLMSDISADYSYNNHGLITDVTRTGNVTTSYSYNNANLLSQVSNKRNGGVISEYDYEYYANGSIERMFENTGSSILETSYVYDNMGRLTVENRNGETDTYSYDIYGNRKTGNNIEYFYDKNNRMTKVVDKDISEVYEYGYDDNGNLTSAGTSKYSYDTFNRLTNSEIASYDYRPDGLRNSKTVDGVKTTHAYDGQNIVMDTKGVGTQKFIRGVGVYKAGTRTDYYIKNGHGDVKKLIDVNSGKVTESYEYDAFGVSSDVGVNPLRYAGEYTDFESGLVYLRARYYSPMAGRFLNEDPIRDGVNWYAYCGGDPVNFIDPLGLSYTGQDVKDMVSHYDDTITKLNTLISRKLEYSAPSLTDAQRDEIKGKADELRKQIKNSPLMDYAIFSLLYEEAFGSGRTGTIEQVEQLIYAANAITALYKVANDGSAGGTMTNAQHNWLHYSGKAISEACLYQILTSDLEAVCFDEKTLISTARGNKYIKDIKVGDYVYSRNEETGEQGFKEVVNVFENQTDAILYITVGEITIKTTPTHPFWIEGKGWTPAIQILVDDIVITKDNDRQKIKDVKIELLAEPQKVYNFEVKDWHTYFVSDLGIWVHNTCDVIGVPHGSEQHKQTINNIVSDMVATGSFSQIFVNKSLKTAGLFGSQRPDVIGLSKSGTNTIVEVRSITQMTEGKNPTVTLENKIIKMGLANPTVTVKDYNLDGTERK